MFYTHNIDIFKIEVCINHAQYYEDTEKSKIIFYLI